MRIMALAGLATTMLALTAPAHSADPAPVSAAVDPSQQIVCRREKETGSLVRSKKTCHTKAQWAYIDDTNQSFARRLADENTSKASGN